MSVAPATWTALCAVAGVVLGAEPAEHVSIDFIRQGRRASAKAQLAPLPNQPAP